MFPVLESKAISGLPWESNESAELVTKFLYRSEETRQREPEILDTVYKIAKTDPEMI